MKADFPFAPNDQVGLVAEHMDGQGRLPLMRFGMCLVRLLKTDTNILLDAGLGAWLPDVKKCSGHPVPCEPPHSLTSLLATLGLTLKDIHFVVYSHCHGDHVGWTAQLENAIHCIHQREYEFATFVGCPWRQDAVQRFEKFQESGKLRLLEGELAPIDAEKAPGISLILTDGHTPGHACVEIKSGDKTAVYIGDAMHYPLQVQDPDVVPLFDCCAWQVRPFLPFGDTSVTWSPALRQRPSTWNETTSAKSRRNILKLLADRQALLLSPHFAPPGAGYVTQSDDGNFQFDKVKEDGYAVIV
jgi:glyoxylase-like metal-dependent hydrolase (beta-lactamase superfamily II)